jgi:cell division protein FtsB
MTDKEIIIDGVDVNECEKLGETIDGITCGLGKRIRFANEIITKHNLCKNNPNCYYKQLKRKEQECEELHSRTASIIYNLTGGRLSYSTYTLEGCADAYHDQLKMDVERATKELEEENETLKQEVNTLEQALDEIEKIAQQGLEPICYKSNCSRCKCYDGDNCQASVTEFLNQFFDDNGDMRKDEDFSESLIALVDNERLKCNRAKPISEKILSIINKTKGRNNDR